MSKKNGSSEAKKFSLAEWRSARLHELTLSSGLTVKVRDITMADLLFTGKMPPAIIAMAKDAANDGASNFDIEAMAKNADEFNQMLNTLVEICLVEPQIGTVADDEHILLAEIPTNDKMEIFQFVNREAQRLSTFREGQDQPDTPA